MTSHDRHVEQVTTSQHISTQHSPSSHLDVHDVRVVEVLQQIFHLNEN